MKKNRSSWVNWEDNRGPRLIWWWPELVINLSTGGSNNNNNTRCAIQMHRFLTQASQPKINIFLAGCDHKMEKIIFCHSRLSSASSFLLHRVSSIHYKNLKNPEILFFLFEIENQTFSVCRTQRVCSWYTFFVKKMLATWIKKQLDGLLNRLIIILILFLTQKALETAHHNHLFGPASLDKLILGCFQTCGVADTNMIGVCLFCASGCSL